MGKIARSLPVMAVWHDMSTDWTMNFGQGNDNFSLADLEGMRTFLEGDLEQKSEFMEYRDKLQYYLTGVAGVIVCCLGTIANALSVAVLTRRSMRSSTYTYLTSLAVCDSLVLILTLLIVINDVKPPDSPEQTDRFYAVIFPFVHPTVVVLQVTSIWLTLAFTVDRYIMICHPFKAERMCRRSRARKVTVCLYVAGLVFNIPRYLEYRTKVDSFLIGNSSQTVYGIDATNLGKNPLFVEIVHSWMYLVFICGLPFFSLVVLNAFLIRAVHLSRLKGKEINPREKHRNDTTVMLIGVIIIFLICQGPALVSRMVYAFNQLIAHTKGGFTLNEVANLFVLLNSAINIVPYYLFGRKFRSEFWRLFCSCFFDKDELWRITRSYSISVDHRRMSQFNVMEMNGVLPNDKALKKAKNKADDSSKKAQRPYHIYSCQRKRPTANGSTTCLRHSDTTDSVAAPLIHNTNGVHSDSSKDSIKTSSVFSSPELSPQCAHLTPSDHIHYMSVAMTPNSQNPDWSVV